MQYDELKQSQFDEVDDEIDDDQIDDDETDDVLDDAAEQVVDAEVFIPAGFRANEPRRRRKSPLRDIGPPKFEPPITTETDQVIWQVVCRNFLRRHPSPDEKRDAMLEAYQEGHVWAAAHPGATLGDIRKETARIADRIRYRIRPDLRREVPLVVVHPDGTEEDNIHTREESSKRSKRDQERLEARLDYEKLMSLLEPGEAAFIDQYINADQPRNPREWKRFSRLKKKLQSLVTNGHSRSLISG